MSWTPPGGLAVGWRTLRRCPRRLGLTSRTLFFLHGGGRAVLIQPSFMRLSKSSVCVDFAAVGRLGAARRSAGGCSDAVRVGGCRLGGGRFFGPHRVLRPSRGGGGFCISTALLLIWLPEVGCTVTARARAAAIGKPNQAVSQKPGHLASGLRNRHNAMGGSVEHGSAIPFVCIYPVEHWDSISGIYLCTCCTFCTCVSLICWSRSGHSLLG